MKYFLSIALFSWPIVLLLYKLFGLIFLRVVLPCGSLKVRAAFRFDMNVMTRIVSKEFFGGGVVDAVTMKILYKRYGPLSWEYSENRALNLWRGLCLWCDRHWFYVIRHRKEWAIEDQAIIEALQNKPANN